MNFSSFFLLAQDQGPGPNAGDVGAAGAAVGAVVLLFELAILVVIIAGMWMCFTKAGKPGWAAIVPIYNGIVLLEIAGKPLWWILLFFIPCVNIVISLLVLIDFAKAYGKGVGFAIGLWLLGPIFFPILGFGDARYLGPPKQSF